jgi:hypothetical protein
MWRILNRCQSVRALHFCHLLQERSSHRQLDTSPQNVMRETRSHPACPPEILPKQKCTGGKAVQPFQPHTVARMSHVAQIKALRHTRPGAQLIFAHATGMVMVNVIAGGRSNRNNVIAVLASRRSGVWRSFRVFLSGFRALQQRVRGGACVGQCGCASKKLGAARHVIARAGLRGRIRSRFAAG